MCLFKPVQRCSEMVTKNPVIETTKEKKLDSENMTYDIGRLSTF